VTPIAHPTAAQAAGSGGEDDAAQYLARHGLRLIARNYRTRLGEIDLIGWDGPELVFVEVRLRKDDRFGGALASITPRKRSRIITAARQYLMRFPRVPPCRFDVVCIQGGEPHWIRGAFALDSQG
jgi:putative endonuclease